MFNIKRLFKSFRYALKGLIKTFKEEQNLRVQSVAALVVILMAWYFQIERLEWGLIIFAIGLVIFAELVNSAIEKISDLFKPRIDIYIKLVKDITAAAVLVASSIAVIIGLIVFWPYLFKY